MKSEEQKKYTEITDIPEITNDEIEDSNNRNTLNNELLKTFNDSELNDYNIYDFSESHDEPMTYNDAEERMKITKDTAKAFLKNAKSDRFWKSIYAGVLLLVLVAQIYWLNDIFLKVGRGELIYDESTFNIYITASLIEVIAIVKLVVKHLFHDNISSSFKNVFNESKSNYNSKKH